MITQTFDLNMIPDSEPVVIHVNQYDVGESRLVISLYKDDTAYNPSVGATAAIQGMKPDGHGFDYAASLAGNVVTANVTEQMTAAAGMTRCQVVISEGGNVTGTFVFLLDVQKSALPSDADMSASDYALVQEMIDAAEQAEGEASESATSAAESEANAASSETNAAASESNAEAWAVGERGGEPVPSTDPTYHNNAEYWAEQAAASAARSGHTIRDNDGTPTTARTSLQFMGSVVEDDATNDKTIVYPGILEYYMGIHNDWFSPILDDDGNTIISDDNNAILADWQYKYA